MYQEPHVAPGQQHAPVQTGEDRADALNAQGISANQN